VTRRPRRFRRAPHPVPPVPKQRWLEMTLSASLRSEEHIASDRAARPSTVRRPPRVRHRSEDPLGLRRHPKTPPEMGRVSAPAGIRRHRRNRTQPAPRRSPKAPPVHQLALSSPRPKPRRFLSGPEAPSIPLRDRSLVDSSPGPKSLRIEHLRSTRWRPKPLSNRTSG
jgi:hypothetical protein